MSDSDRPKPSMKRPSLKELAERVSKTPPPPAVQTPLPINKAPAVESAPPPASIASPPASVSAPPSLSLAARASALPAAGAGPSSVAPSSVAPSSVAQSSVAQSSVAQSSVAQSGVGPSSVVAPSQPAPSNVVPLTAAKRESEKKGGSYIGLIIAAAGIAAAAGIFFFLQTNKSTPTSARNTKTLVVEEDKPVAEGTAEATAEPVQNGEAKPEAPKDDGALDLADLTKPDATAEPTPGVVPTTTNADPNSKAPRPEKVAMEGTLEDQMKETVGPIEKKDEAQPASGQETGPKNVPDQPPQGSVTSAVNKVMGGAKACVAGADDVSRATITFSSSGAVQSVTVGGWAAGKGSVVSCIKSALSGATVGPFSKPTYSFSVTIRP